MQNPLVKMIIISLVAFLLSAGSSYALTTYLYTPGNGGPLTPISTPGIGGGLNLDPSLPRTAECPVNGEMFTEQERGVWESRRPLFVMIENSVDARPQSGLGSADIVYEGISEGGISRFGAVFYCGVAHKDTVIGPVRSARTHFVNVASEYNFPLYAHVGGANCSSPDGGKTCLSDKRVQALEQIAKYGWNQDNDLNQFSIGFPTYWRDYERLGRTVATEHTMYSSTEKLWQFAKTSRGWTNLSPGGDDWEDDYTSWEFKDEAELADRGNKSPSFGFWESYSDFNVTWKYDSSTNSYSRDNGGKRHYDLNDDSQFDAKVVIVQFVEEEGPVDELKHMYYEMIGKGDALIFQDGEVIEASWKKLSREARTVFTNSKGKELELNRGPIWIEILPSDNAVNY